MKRSILICSVISFLFYACGEEQVSIPRPHSYPRIEFKKSSFTPFSESYCPITFEYSERGKISKKKFYFNDSPSHECWFNITIPEHDATVYFTYQDIDKKSSIENLVDDAFLLVSKHNSKANSREESQLKNQYGIEGLMFEIGGPVASPIQFYMTDYENHFFRGSLYYNNGTASDSLSVVTAKIKKDLLHIANTIQFR